MTQRRRDNESQQRMSWILAARTGVAVRRDVDASVDVSPKRRDVDASADVSPRPTKGVHRRGGDAKPILRDADVTVSHGRI